MRLVAERDTQLAIVHDDGETGFVYNMGEDQRFPDQNIHSILARGYWEEPAIDLSSAELERIAGLPLAGGGR